MTADCKPTPGATRTRPLWSYPEMAHVNQPRPANPNLSLILNLNLNLDLNLDLNLHWPCWPVGGCKLSAVSCKLVYKVGRNLPRCPEASLNGVTVTDSPRRHSARQQRSCRRCLLM